MAISVTHTFVSPVADDSDPNEVGPDEWNATHTISGTLPVANGGTASATAADARTALGLAIGTDVQAYDAQLADIAGLAVTDGNIIVGDGANWVAESGATARTSLGLGTGNSPQFTAIELSHASQNTLTASGGVLSIEGNALLKNVVEDTTPQLGGSLDLNGTYLTDVTATLESRLYMNMEPGVVLYNENDGAAGPIFRFHHSSANPADGDIPATIQVVGGEDSGVLGRIRMELDDGGTGSADSHWEHIVNVAGAEVDLLTIGDTNGSVGWGILNTGMLVPGADASMDIGTSTVGINDLHLGSGGVINFDGSDVTITHSANALDIDGGVVDFGSTPTRAGNAILDSTTGQPLDADLTSWAGVTRAAGFDTFAATPSSANLRSLLSDESGSGAALFQDGALGTPASGTLTNCTGLPSVVVANEASDTTCFPLFVTNTTGELGPKTNADFTYNASTDQLGVPTISLTGGQIAFPATQAASAGANTLDDYEEGTFTTTIITSGVAPTTLTYTTQLGIYTKIGRMVNVSIGAIINAFTLGAGTGNISLTTLPFASSSASTAVLACYTIGVDWPAASYVIGYVGGSATTVVPYSITDNTGATQLTLAGLAATDQIFCSGSYEV
jgi:hypothetical protein